MKEMSRTQPIDGLWLHKPTGKAYVITHIWIIMLTNQSSMIIILNIMKAHQRNQAWLPRHVRSIQLA